MNYGFYDFLKQKLKNKHCGVQLVGEMNKSLEVNASSLAITEKRPRRIGGCVGIFFQLFDWNRRFAKKKLFSKKLLPPARAKQASKTFGGDEKLPKLRLIADENSGGFPNVKKNGACNVDSEHKNGVRTPGLVARLMGLESMPNVQQDRSKKGSFVKFGGGGKKGKFESDHCELGNADPCLEKGSTKNDFRPQKLQKTGLVERGPVTRFGAEALQLKNVLSRSRMHHHPKRATPVKSPRNHPGRNTSRLIGVATKILEPKNRARNALTYTHHMRRDPTNEYMFESTKSVAPESSNCYTSASKLLNGQPSCKNCGNLLDVVDSRPNTEDHLSVFVSPVSNYVKPSPQVSERSNPRFTNSSLDQENEIDQLQWPLRSQQLRPQNIPTLNYFRDETQRQTEVSLHRERYPTQSKLSCPQMNRAMSPAHSVSETKDFVVLNRSLSGQARLRVKANVDDIKFDKGRKLDSRRDNSLSPGQKRRSMNASRQVESSGLVTSTFDKPRIINSITSNGKEMRQNGLSPNHTCNESRLAQPGESNRIGGSGNKDSEATTFTFSSPMKERSGIPTKVDRRRDQNACPGKSTPQKSSRPKESDGKTCTQKPFPLTGDTLGALLEQKLKELTSQEDGLALGGAQPKRTSAKIFEELIYPLNAGRPLCQNEMDSRPHGRSLPRFHDHVSNPNASFCFQAKPKTAGASVGYSHSTDHFSPGSVLEASFSNDSCCSSSLEDSSGHIMHADSLSCSYDEPQPLNPESDVFYSGTSLSKEKTGRELVINLHNYIAGVLCSIDLRNATLKGNKLNHAKNVIMNTELVLGNETSVFSVSRFLLDELETLASVMWTNFSNFLGFEDTKEGNQLQGFLFDCLIDYLDSRYAQYSESGFRAWTKLPLCMNAEILIHEVVEEIRRWMGFAGLIPDELIEREMSHCLGKWTDFEIEAYKTGVEIDGDILQILVDEVVIDLMAGISC